MITVYSILFSETLIGLFFDGLKGFRFQFAKMDAVTSMFKSANRTFSIFNSDLKTSFLERLFESVFFKTFQMSHLSRGVNITFLVTILLPGKTANLERIRKKNMNRFVFKYISCRNAICLKCVHEYMAGFNFLTINRKEATI